MVRYWNWLFGAFMAVPFLLLVMCSEARAVDFYATAGFGTSQLQHPGVNKWWIQEGWDYTIQEKSNTWRVGVGAKFNKYLAIEAQYHDLGSYNHFAGFIPDEENYNTTEPDLCTGTCSPTMWAYLRGEAKAVSLSAVLSQPVTKNIGVFGRIGFAFYQAKFEMRATPVDPQGKHWIREGANFGQRGISPVYGLGVTLGNFSLEVMRMPGVQANAECCSPFQAAVTKTISYRWDL